MNQQCAPWRRWIPLFLIASGLTAAVAVTRAAAPSIDEPARPTCRLRLELVDAETGHPLPGVVTVRDESGAVVELDGLLPRGIGVPGELSIHDWYLLPQASELNVPGAKLTIQAFQGLETELTTTVVDLRGKIEAKLTLPLKRFVDAHARGLQSGNTHIHLQKVSIPASKRYLLEVALAEQLELLYISFLERAEADLEYTTNKYSAADLQGLTEQSRRAVKFLTVKSHAHPHVHRTEFDNGQEHRHNFAAHNEGYGHVMLLHLPELILPVSIGPGLTLRGTDSPPLRAGIEQAARLGSTIIWCHNAWGLEDIPNWIAGKLHANNIFDGGARGSYRHSFYRYLNAGMKVPFSTGTDWFIYDFSRVYVVAEEASVGGDRYLSSTQWLQHLAAGRSFITNGPLLDFTVNGHRVGDTVDLAQPREIEISCRAVGRLDFQRLELIRNGEILSTADAQAEDGHFVAAIRFQQQVDQPCWFALRTPPPSAPDDPELQRPTPLNEYGRELFAHTSAIYVDLAGRHVFQPEAAADLVAEMRKGRDLITSHASFSNDEERDRVLQVYDQSIASMQAKIKDAR